MSGIASIWEDFSISRFSPTVGSGEAAASLLALLRSRAAMTASLFPIALCHLPEQRSLLASWIPRGSANLRQFLSDDVHFLLGHAALFLVVLRD
jgi:hypothetical protein